MPGKRAEAAPGEVQNEGAHLAVVKVETVEREAARVVQVDVVGLLGLDVLKLQVHRRDLSHHLIGLQVLRRERHAAQVAGHRVPRRVEIAKVRLRVVWAEDAVRQERHRQPAHTQYTHATGEHVPDWLTTTQYLNF